MRAKSLNLEQLQFFFISYDGNMNKEFQSGYRNSSVEFMDENF